jgi:hypothetical protein
MSLIMPRQENQAIAQICFSSAIAPLTTRRVQPAKEQAYMVKHDRWSLSSIDPQCAHLQTS